MMGANHAVERAGYGIAALVAGIMAASFGFVVTFRNLSLFLLVAGIGFLLYTLGKMVN